MRDCHTLYETAAQKGGVTPAGLEPATLNDVFCSNQLSDGALWYCKYSNIKLYRVENMEMFEKAKEIIKGDDRVFFLKDVADKLEISKQKFFEMFPTGSDKRSVLSKLLRENREKTAKMLNDMMENNK